MVQHGGRRSALGERRQDDVVLRRQRLGANACQEQGRQRLLLDIAGTFPFQLLSAPVFHTVPIDAGAMEGIQADIDPTGHLAAASSAIKALE